MKRRSAITATLSAILAAVGLTARGRAEAAEKKNVKLRVEPNPLAVSRKKR